MILAALYFSLFCLVISKHSFFKDEHLPLKVLFLIIGIKTVACFAYYYIYFCYYSTSFDGDSADTMQDAAIMYSALPNNILDYCKMVFGFHSELLTDPLHINYFEKIQKWGRVDVSTQYFLNDNRTPIRINALIMLLSHGNYAVHALVMLIASFIGQLAIYKTLKRYFITKEKLLALALFLLPNVLFWTSGVLKEPIAYFALGMFIYSFFKLIIDKRTSLKYCVLLLTSVGLFIIIKPYILLLFALPLTLFAIVNNFKIKRVLLFYCASIFVIVISGITILKYVFKRDIIQTIVIRQNDFVNLSEGGIFFLNSSYVKRLNYNDSLSYKLVDKKNELYKINKHTNLMCWPLLNMRDTFYVKDNADTSLYKLINNCPPARSAINMGRLTYSWQSFVIMIPKALYVVALKPLFFDAKSVLELLASLENLLIITFYGLCFYYRNKNSSNYNFLIFCIILVIISFLLVGFTTTVLGAIVRYKIPFLPFLVMIPLLYLNSDKLKKVPFLKHLV